MKKICIISMSLIFPIYVFSGVYGKAKVEGVVVSYNKDIVVLSQNGKTFKVPKKNIPSHLKLKTGKAVYALFDSQKMMKKLEKSLKKQKNPPSKKAKKQKK